MTEPDVGSGHYDDCQVHFAGNVGDLRICRNRFDNSRMFVDRIDDALESVGNEIVEHFGADAAALAAAPTTATERGSKKAFIEACAAI